MRETRLPSVHYVSLEKWQFVLGIFFSRSFSFLIFLLADTRIRIAFLLFREFLSFGFVQFAVFHITCTCHLVSVFSKLRGHVEFFTVSRILTSGLSSWNYKDTFSCFTFLIRLHVLSVFRVCNLNTENFLEDQYVFVKVFLRQWISFEAS